MTDYVVAEGVEAVQDVLDGIGGLVAVVVGHEPEFDGLLGEGGLDLVLDLDLDLMRSFVGGGESY